MPEHIQDTRPGSIERAHHTDVAVTLMSAEEARDCVRRVQAGLENVRALLLDLYEREGWRALGYDSWDACAVAELSVSRRHAYQILNAAKVDRTLGLCAIAHWAAIPESHARELAPLARADPEAAREVWNETVAEHGEDMTAADLRAAVGRRLGPKTEDSTEDEAEDEGPAPAQPVLRPETTAPVRKLENAQIDVRKRPGLPPWDEPPEEKAYWTILRDLGLEQFDPEIVAATNNHVQFSVSQAERLEALGHWVLAVAAALRAQVSGPVRVVK